MSRSKANRDKRNKAVALKYNMEEDPSPIVIASGYGEIAEKIVTVAESAFCIFYPGMLEKSPQIYYYH